MRTIFSKYTILIAKQKGEYFIYPDNTTSWDLISGDTIEILNKTESEVTVIFNPEGWFTPDPNPINASGKATGTVEIIEGYKAPLEFTFSIPTHEVFVMSGGPKMVPTEPVEL